MSGKTVREGIGFLGVVGSLIFVGLEVRQNTLAARATAYQVMGEAITGQWLNASETPERAALSLRMFEEESAAFTPDEEAVLIHLQIAALRQFETTWRQVELGLLGPEVLDQMGWGALGTTAYTQNAARMWPRIAPLMSPDFKAFIELRFGFIG